MRKKEKRLIVAFYTTHDAMAFEDYCLSGGVPGRLIPLPGAISAGCGLAWSSPPAEEERVAACLRETGIAAQHVVVMEA